MFDCCFAWEQIVLGEEVPQVHRNFFARAKIGGAESP